MNAFKPTPSTQVLNQRFGDCKDKSLLLISLLKKIDVEAYPLLVHSSHGQNLLEVLPSHNAFDHCVVNFEYNDQEFFVDPTISNQGGNLENLYFPDYKYGLKIKEGLDSLTSIPNKNLGKLEIYESIYIDSIGGSANFVVQSKYFGDYADRLRSYFKENSRKEIENNYRTYYSNLYPNITSNTSLIFKDEQREDVNEIIIIEDYKVDECWALQPDSTTIHFETYPLVLGSDLDFPSSPERTMPFHTGKPINYKQVTKIHLPEPWYVPKESVTVENDYFNYHNLVSYDNDVIEITHTFDKKGTFVNAESLSNFRTDIEQVKAQFMYYLSYETNGSGYKLSKHAIFIGFLTLILAFYFFKRLYIEYNPFPKSNAISLPIGGWLILPAIGICLTPFFLIYQLVEIDFFNQQTWDSLKVYEGNLRVNMTFLFIFEMIYNLLFLSYTILIIFLFFKRRSSLPQLITIFYLCSFIVPLIDGLLYTVIDPDMIGSSILDNFDRQVFKSFITLIIWGLYFNVSERVYNTFIFDSNGNRHSKESIAIP